MGRERRRGRRQRAAGPGRRMVWLALAVGLLAAAVVAALTASFYVGGGGSGAEEEVATRDGTPSPADDPFRSFRNLTGYPDSVLWEAYRYARANPQVLGYIPCFCGCVHHGDTSNLGCYVDEIRPDGSVRYDPHAAG